VIDHCYRQAGCDAAEENRPKPDKPDAPGGEFKTATGEDVAVRASLE